MKVDFINKNKDSIKVQLKPTSTLSSTYSVEDVDNKAVNITPDKLEFCLQGSTDRQYTANDSSLNILQLDDDTKYDIYVGDMNKPLYTSLSPKEINDKYKNNDSLRTIYYDFPKVIPSDVYALAISNTDGSSSFFEKYGQYLVALPFLTLFINGEKIDLPDYIMLTNSYIVGKSLGYSSLAVYNVLPSLNENEQYPYSSVISSEYPYTVYVQFLFDFSMVPIDENIKKQMLTDFLVSTEKDGKNPPLVIGDSIYFAITGVQ